MLKTSKPTKTLQIMKNLQIWVISILLLSSTMLTSCVNPMKYKRLEKENDSLRNIVQQSDFTLQKYLTAFNEIQQNLNEIKQKENIINVSTTGVEGQLSENVKDQINQDIQTIYSLMQENKQKLEALKKQLAASRNKNRQLLKTIQLYEQQIQLKDQEINKLRKRLEEMNINIQQLNEQVTQLKQNVDTLKQIQQQQQQKIQQQDIALHTAYYVVGTKRELIDHGVVNRQGFLSKLDITADFDKSYFTEIDIRRVTRIPVMAKKIQIMTKHPSDSYTLEKNGKQIEYLVITEPDKFWETSKFLVIMTK